MTAMRQTRGEAGGTDGADEAGVLALMRRALAGESLTVGRNDHTLHELTQIALAMRPHAGLRITGAATMSPLERASIATVGRGRVSFL